jgi:hypothetical protein
MLVTVCSGPAFGQGTFLFQNILHPEVDAPVFDANGIPLAGSNYLAELWGGSTAGSLTPATYFGSRVIVPFFTGDLAGYLRGGDVEVAGIPVGAPGWVQIRAWEARLGATYEAVLGLGLGGYGESPSLHVPSSGGAGLPPTPGAYLTGLQSFSLRPIVPEPSAIGLLLLGGLLLFWRERFRG